MIKYGFFSSIQGDRVYDAEDLACMYDGLVSDGVIRGLGAQLEVTACDKMQVLVGTGKAIVGRKWVWNTEQLALTIPPANESSVRIDLIVARADFVNREVSFEVVKGDDIGSLPKPVDTSTIKEIPLATLSIPAAATKIKTENIHDARSFASITDSQNSAVTYKGKRWVYVSGEATASAPKFIQRTDGLVITRTLEVNGNKIVDITVEVEVEMASTKSYKIKPILPQELNQIPAWALVSYVSKGDAQIAYLGSGVDTSDGKRYFDFAVQSTSASGHDPVLSMMKIHYMEPSNEYVIEY